MHSVGVVCSTLRPSSTVISMAKLQVSLSVVTDCLRLRLTLSVRANGVVINSAGVTVGVLLGGGLGLSFSAPSAVTTFSVCLLVSGESFQSYQTHDFGYSVAPLSFIYPLSANFNNC